MKKTPLQTIKLLALVGTVCTILSLMYSCKKTENAAGDKSNTLTLQEAQSAANNMGTQYWQNGNEHTITPEMPDWGNAKLLTVANQANTVSVPIKEKQNSAGGYRKLMLAKRNNKILSVMLVVKPSALYLQAHGKNVSAKDFSGDLHFYSAFTGKYIKGARMDNGKWMANLRAVNPNETYSAKVLAGQEAAKSQESYGPVVLIPQTTDEPDIPEDNTDHPSPPWEGGQEYPGGEGWDNQPYEDPYQPGDYYENEECSYTQAEAQQILDGITATEHFDTHVTSSGPQTIQNGIIKEPKIHAWKFFSLYMFPGHTPEWSAYFSGVRYKLSQNDSWKWESFNYTNTERSGGIEAPCTNVEMFTNVSTLITPDNLKAKAVLYYNAKIKIPCMFGYQMDKEFSNTHETSFYAWEN